MIDQERKQSRVTPPGALSRRTVLRRGAALGIALPSFLPTFLRASPAESIATAHVGVGGRGGSLLGGAMGNSGTRVAAVCDVDAQRLAAAKKRVGGEVEGNGDYRPLLDRKDIDAVVIATPDHWHAGVTISACQAGKDVYVEKPASHNVAEGRAMVKAARQHERVVQVGTHHRSASYTREIARIVRGGRIGRVRAVRMWMWENLKAARTPVRAPPKHLDWNRWLGPAPVVGYHPERVHFNFRWCRDYAGGYMTDWGVHMMSVITMAMDIDHQGPTSVEASGQYAPDNLYDFPMRMEARWEFADPDFELTWTQPSEGGDVLPGARYAMNFYGEDGELRCGFGPGLHKFYRDGKEAPLPREGRSVDVPESAGHFENWLDCVRTRGRPIADIEIGHRLTATCLLANIALFSGERGRLRWDWKKERFVDNDAANAWLGRSEREEFRV